MNEFEPKAHGHMAHELAKLNVTKNGKLNPLYIYSNIRQ